jgi:hypothetical protein
MDNDDSFPVRIGMFFYVMGGGIFILFVASDFADKADFDYLFIALAFFAIGWYFRREKKPPPRVERFTYAKKFFENMKRKKSPPPEKKK